MWPVASVLCFIVFLSINKHHASLVLCWLDARTTAATSSSHTQPLSLLSPSLSVFLSLSCTQLVWLYTKTFSVTTAGYLLIIWVICSSCIYMKHQAVGRKQNTMRFIQIHSCSSCPPPKFLRMLQTNVKTPRIFLLLAAAFLICCFSCLSGNSTQVWYGRLHLKFMFEVDYLID